LSARLPGFVTARLRAELIRAKLTARRVASTFAFMRSALLVAILGLVLVGCAGEAPLARSDADTQFFGPVSMRLHPIFTQLKDWTGSTKPDGIEALVELEDQFGDPTKASGRIIFELYNFRQYDPQRKGERVVNPWIGYLETLDEQRDRWNRTSRTYGFQLAYPQIDPTKSYVLTAEFEGSNGGRFFDQIILEGKLPDSEIGLPPTTLPTTAPTTAPSAP
jgi:hypothetical protein